MLSDSTIAAMIGQGVIMLDDCGMKMDQSQFQPASIDLRLDRMLIRRAGGGDIPLLADWGQPVPLAPGSCFLASTVESVGIPNDMGAIVDGKSTWGRRFLIVHSTAGYIDPGFKGQITLEISNIGEQPVTIHPGDRICQIRFFWLTAPALRPYGHPDLSSHYQHQAGPTLPHNDSLTTISEGEEVIRGQEEQEGQEEDRSALPA